MALIKPVHGIIWDAGVICNAGWTGIRLSDVLRIAGVQIDKAAHVCFSSHVTRCQDDDYYGASIPLKKGLDDKGDVLLAYEVICICY